MSGFLVVILFSLILALLLLWICGNVPTPEEMEELGITPEHIWWAGVCLITLLYVIGALKFLFFSY